MGEISGASILCVDIGGTSTKAGVLSTNGEITHVNSILSKPDAGTFFENLAELVARTKANVVDGGNTEPRQLGVAVAGFLDDRREYLVYNSNLAWLEKFPLRQRLEKRFPGLEIALEVDSNAATMAEYHFGSGQCSSRFLCVTAGTGLGVGMTIEGKPLRFAYGCLGDIGHTVVMRDGPVCTCGGRGCAEILVSAVTLASEYARLSGNDRASTLRDVIERAQAGEAQAMSVLETAGEWLGVAIASMANTFFPDHIAIAGGLSAAEEFVMKPAERVFRETACVLARSSVTFTRAKLGPMATLIGAAWPFWQKEEVNGKSIA